MKTDSIGLVVYWVVTRLSDITDKILPFFDKYPLQGSKALDYADFRKTVYNNFRIN